MRWIAIVVTAACACRSAPQQPIAATSPKREDAPAEPKKKIEIVTETKVEILDPIKFLPGSPMLDVTSIPILDAIASTLTGNPSIKKVAVQAFGSDAPAILQARLGASRAQVIVDALIARGVESRRLVPEGDAQPPSGRSSMPVFLILERAD